MPRPIRRAPVFAAHVALACGIGMGAGVPVLTLLASALRRASPYGDPLLGGEPEPGWFGAPSPRYETMAAAQDAGLTVLLQVVLGLAILLVAVAMVNLATLLLVRGAARRAELAVHAALGATPARLAARLLREGSAFLALGLAAAAALAGAALPLLIASWPGAPLFDARSVPATVPVLGVAAFAGTLLAAWAAPVLGTARRDLRRHLNGGGRATPTHGEVLLRNGLVAMQLAALLVLLTAAGLLLRAVLAAPDDADGPGVGADVVLTMQVELPSASAEARSAFYRRALERLSAVPGVRAAGFATPGAWVGPGPADPVWSRCSACWDGMLFKPFSVARPAIHAVSPGAFAAPGVARVEGREFAAADTGRVVVINTALARAIFPNGAPVGQQVRLGPGEGAFAPGGTWYTVIGIVEEIRSQGIGIGGGPRPALYLPALRHPPIRTGLAVRVDGEPMRHLPRVAAAVLAAAPGARLHAPMPMSEYRARIAAPLRWFGRLLSGLAAGALLLAAAGLYGVMRYNVARRTREIGVRMALGADGRQVTRMVLGQALRVAAAGTGLGLLAALPLAQGMGAVSHGVRAFDPALFALVAAALAGVAAAAGLRPARKAARTEPHAALREE